MVDDQKNHSRKIRILLVNDVRLMGNIVAASLADEPDLEIVGCASTIEEALALIQKDDIDVALVSTKLQEGAIKLTQRIVEQAPSTKVLAFGVSDHLNLEFFFQHFQEILQFHFFFKKSVESDADVRMLIVE